MLIDTLGNRYIKSRVLPAFGHGLDKVIVGKLYFFGFQYERNIFRG